MTQACKLPIIPLTEGLVLFPGVTIRIPLLNRPDIPTVLSSLFSDAGTHDETAVPPLHVGCVPRRSSSHSHGEHKFDGVVTRESLENLDNTGSLNVTDARDDINTLISTFPDQQPGISKDDLSHFGTLAKIVGLQSHSASESYLLVEGIKRMSILDFVDGSSPLKAKVVLYEETKLSAEHRRLFEDLKVLSSDFVTLLRIAPLVTAMHTTLSPLSARRFETQVSQQQFSHAHVLADLIASMVVSTYEQKLRILSEVDLKQRMELVHSILLEQVQSLKKHLRGSTIATHGISPIHRRRGLMSAAIRRQSDDDGADDVKELDDKLRNSHLPKEVQQVVNRELKRYKRMNPANAEYAVCRNYLETLAEIPWSKTTNDKLGPDSLRNAKKQLDDDHYGLENVKKRLLEYLAVLKLKQSLNADTDAEHEQLSLTIGNLKSTEESTTALEHQLQQLETNRSMDKAPILLFVGPPGTGKTSLAKSIATSLGRKFHRISLGGVRDEAEIRGHRRTYVAAMPGMFVNGLKKVGVCNPLFLLDEIDKVGQSGGSNGDPSAAMLEVLDPEQNHTFSDHYVNLPIDLSKVLFIATANNLDTIPPPLLDRMEVINLSGYTPVAKRHIARSHLVSKQIRTNGLSENQVDIPDEVLDRIVSSYTHEAGVRNLERQIGSICRYKAVQFAESIDSEKLDSYNPRVAIKDLETILGLPPLSEEITDNTSNPGTVTGLVAYSGGGQGGILFIEVADTPGTGKVQLTGTLGNVLKESVEVALTWVKAHAFELGLLNDIHQDIMNKRDIHVHCPAGGIPKDGPSAGLAHTIALISLFASKPVPPKLAMTGEVSLRGRVMPVGGIKEKLIGADRAGVKSVLLPEANRRDVTDVPDEVKQNLQIHHISNIAQAIKHVWPGEPVLHIRQPNESRL